MISDDDTFIMEMEYSTLNQAAPVAVAGTSTSTAASMAESPDPLPQSPTPTSVGAVENDDQVVEPANTPAVWEEDLDAYQDEGVPLCLQAIDDIIRSVQPQGLARHVLVKELNVVSSDKPNTFDEAEQDPC
jgi:hypothetical protein